MFEYAEPLGAGAESCVMHGRRYLTYDLNLDRFLCMTEGPHERTASTEYPASMMKDLNRHLGSQETTT